MKGPGKTTKEGQQGRIHDGTELMDFAFLSFADFTRLEDVKSYFVKVYSAKEKAINLIPAYIPEAVCVPFVTGNSLAENLKNVIVELELPDSLEGEITTGTEYGCIKISVGNYLLETIPLVADRSIQQAGFITSLCDKMIR